MKSLNPHLLFGSVRLRSTFADEIGNSRIGIGTGFWVRGRAAPVLVTNRHNLDPQWLFGDACTLRLTALEVELRHYTSEGGASNLTKMFAVDLGAEVHLHADADCAILVSPKFRDHDPSYREPSISILPTDLITEKEFTELLVHPMETAFFIGFAGKPTQPFWDEYWQLAIARQCTVASHPVLHFKNRSISRTHVLLVSGMSFSGSSGSPVYLPAIGVAPGGGLVDSTYRPAKVLGIMSGHFWDQGETPAMFDHTGLSYLTRSSAILELLEQAGELNAGA